MKNYIFVLLYLLIIILSGCSNNGMSGEKPPKAFLEIGNNKYETTLGTYCWTTGNNGECVDTAGPVELLEGKKPIEVKPGEKIAFVMDYEPKPNEFHVTQINNNEETEVFVRDNRFSVPTQKGIYYYSYGVWWMDEKEEHLSHGDAFYAFVLEVK
ncbi:hypothetical protein [Neobacillus kokaensis]|uniref:Lipoprotein n=1 Tax=Neobacillus kokaensis TaxID=2759023 RepID=A0ABQ3N324_9BACI|nr:hypothetical protein [Neobacillus kokaensis]GHH99314.1 hypothetical protein AM1BK_28570 [Neobacillus kokaensis]